MAGWTRYNEETGETETGLYEYPYIVRGTPAKLGRWDNPEGVTVTAFRTRKDAEEWIKKNGAEYKKGSMGFSSLHIENWNA